MELKKRYHTLVIGTGCAGYHAAERLWMLGVRDIAILTEGVNRGTSRNTGSDKQTYYKLSLCGGDGDSVREMAQTLYSGGAVMGETALIEAAYSTRCFMHLVELGVPFPTNEYGEYAGYKTDHDPRSRATSCGPLTSKYMTEALERSVSEKGIPVFDGYPAVKLIVEENRIRGVVALELLSGRVVTVTCRNVILCTGGAPCIYAHTVYPDSRMGSFGLAIDAGAATVNMDQWQYGIASVGFKWNLSGNYQQVLPRYLSVDAEGVEREFLYDALGKDSLGLTFLKGYEWPFDTRKLNGSSRVDLLVAAEIAQGRRVYLDFTKNPLAWEEQTFLALPPEAYWYLQNADCLFGTPIRRLNKLNPKAVELYASHGIDLSRDRLEIAVCAQHINGGVAVDEHWESTVKGLYAAGECAGTFGVYRPGGSALNATQVGSLRAAEHIAAGEDESLPEGLDCAMAVTSEASDIDRLRGIGDELCREMSLCAAFSRDTARMKELLTRVCGYLEELDMEASFSYEVFTLWNQLLTTREVLSAMLCSAEAVGSHGSALVDQRPPRENSAPRNTRTVTVRGVSELSPVSTMPDPELWFETLLARKKSETEQRRKGT